MTGSLQRWLLDIVTDEMQRQHLTQAALAERVGITPKHMNQLIQGKVQGALGMWERLLLALGHDPETWDLPIGTGESRWSIAQVAAFLGVSESTVRSYSSRGQMPKGRIAGNRLTWSVDEVRAWHAQRPMPRQPRRNWALASSPK